MTPTTDDLGAELERIAEEVRPLAREGDVADYIPALAAEDPGAFALATSDLDGVEHTAGDADRPFCIQSIAKVFALTLALQAVGEDLWERVGREPSGDPFNSLVQLEHEHGKPRNPMINAGALVVCDVLLETLDDPKAAVCDLLGRLVGDDVEVDRTVLGDEGRTASRNTAMANLMAAFGNVHSPVGDVLSVYVHQCAVLMSTRQLARAMRFLANDGVDPGSGQRIVAEPLARRINAIMLTSGTYDSAGQFAYEVGIPCKSGVAGAIAGDVPGRLGVCVWSPPLDASGNSRAGREALHLLAERRELSIF
ncbi:glutaminase [Trujillonella humicola]|uniref:glutaminase n=1 Tax=Trujillonella humicola TaxID=3383699 RepID=UPI003905846D